MHFSPQLEPVCWRDLSQSCVHQKKLVALSSGDAEVLRFDSSVYKFGNVKVPSLVDRCSDQHRQLSSKESLLAVSRWMLSQVNAVLQTCSPKRCETSLRSEVYEHNNECRAVEVIGQTWSSEVVALILDDWELGRVALSCHMTMDLLCQKK